MRDHLKIDLRCGGRDQRLAQALLGYRAKMRWSRRDLARHCDVGEAPIRKYELLRGHTIMRCFFIKLAEGLGLDPDELEGQLDQPTCEEWLAVQFA